MFLMTHPYFMSYHIIATVLMRRFGFLESPARHSFLTHATAVLGLAYLTALLEAWSISGFPHYTYPDQYVMYTIGSAFYAMLFIVTYNVFPMIDHAKPWSLQRTVTSSLASGMLVFCLMDVWRLYLGPVNGGTGALPYAQT